MVNLQNFPITFLAGTLGQGGAERQLYYLLKALRESGAQVELLCLTKGEYWQAEIEKLSVPIRWVGQSPLKLRRLSAIIAALRERPPRIIQSQHFYTNIYVSLAARYLGIREIGAIRNDAISEVRANGKLLGTLSLRMPRRLAANSRAGLNNAISLGVPPNRLHLLPNVIETDLFSAADHQRSDQQLRLLGIGRLTEQKRFDRFIRLVAQLRDRLDRPIKATLIGSGPLLPGLTEQAQALKLLPDQIEFAGARADISSYYQAADLLLLTSDWEGTPNVVLEAMASALPVVATRVGGLAELIESGRNGFLVDPENEADMLNWLVKLAESAALREQIGCQARAEIERHYSARELPARLTELYGVTLNE